MASEQIDDLLELLRTPCMEMESIVRPLSEVSRGETVQIVYINPEPVDKLSRLTALGIAVGAELTLMQKHPAWVVRVGQTEIALDKDIARDIHVKKRDDWR